MIPTLSQVEAYTTDHLVDAAEYWDGLADRWEDAHWQVRNQAHALDWQGVAGDALRARTASDYTVASDHADQLRGTSQIARQQAGELERLRNRVIYAVDDAHNARRPTAAKLVGMAAVGESITVARSAIAGSVAAPSP